jgi:hypothetical protein
MIVSHIDFLQNLNSFVGYGENCIYGRMQTALYYG